eukprot:5541696-Prorocentrum_lima.AAC.1
MSTWQRAWLNWTWMLPILGSWPRARKGGLFMQVKFIPHNGEWYKSPGKPMLQTTAMQSYPAPKGAE